MWPRRQEIQRVLTRPAPIKEVKRTNTVIVRTTPTITLPTVTVPTNMEIDFENTFRNTSDNYDKMRGRMSTPSKQSSRVFSISSTISLVIYYKRMDINNNLENDINMEPIEMTQLLYAIPREQVNQVSTAVDSNNNMINQCVLIKGLALNSSSTSSTSYIDNDNIINIQLPYDPNRPMEPKLWDSNFHPVLLYRLLKHLTSNAENIKKSLACMTIYIKHKKIETSKSNDIKNFKDIDKVAWELISSIYKSEWDLLITDNHKNSFRQKVVYKFDPRINLNKNSKKKEIITNKPANIKRLLPPIPAKSQKEVNKILKYFKPNKSMKTIPSKAKLYTQTMKNIRNTEEVLKIKEAFPSFQVTNINNIQKIINGDNNSKPKP